MIPADTPNRNDYTGNGSAYVYDFTFPIQTQDQLKVWVADADGVLQDGDAADGSLLLDTDYMVSGDGESDGGSVELVDNDQAWLDASGNLATGYKLTILMAPPASQLTDVANEGNFFQEAGENALDKLTMLILWLKNLVSGSLKLPPTEDPDDFNMCIPPLAERAGMTAGYDDDGNPIAGEATLLPYSNWTAFTGTGGWDTNVTMSGFYRRVGDTLEVMEVITLTGAPNAGPNPGPNFPVSLVPDTAKLPGYGVGLVHVGTGLIYDVSADKIYSVNCYATNASVNLLTPGVAPPALDFVTSVYPVVFAAGDSIVLKYAVPITGWD